MSKNEAQRCTKCGVEKKLREFYASDSLVYKNTGRVPICKICLRKMVKDNVSIEDVCRMIDKPYIASLWRSSFVDADIDPVKAFSNYMRQINSLPQYKSMTYEHTSYDAGSNEDGDLTTVEEVKENINPNNYNMEYLKSKWGYEFSAKELVGFEDLYNELQSNYLLKTAQHIEYLKLACISNYKAKVALAENDVKGAKDYLDMFDKIAKSGNLTPAQLSKSDLQGGLNTFGEMVKKVEEEVDIIPILPVFKRQPKDDVDLTIYYYVTYIQHLLDRPLCKYEDLYKFLDERKKDYEQTAAALQGGVEDDGGI